MNFIRCLFSGSASNSGYISLNDSMSEWWIEKDVKGSNRGVIWSIITVWIE
jgi:hypothetical protein